MDILQLKKEISLVLSQGRFKHTLGVAETAQKLALEFGADPQKAELAGLLHDIAKEHKPLQLLEEAEKFHISINNIDKISPHLLHARVGAFIAREQFQIKDSEILNAIAQHTLGKANMTLLEKILFLADSIEPNRPPEWAEPIREELKQKGLIPAIVKSCQITIQEVVEKGFLLHPITVETYNFYLTKMLNI